LCAAACSGETQHAHRAVSASPQAATSRAEYRGSLAFARCMRAHGVPHPDPDLNGDFHLTPRDEERMRKATPKKHEAAERACFKYLKPFVSTKPLSAGAKARAKRALEGLARCMAARGFDFFEDPVVRDLSRGRAFFGFRKSDPVLKKVQHTQAYKRAQRVCEAALNKALDRIIREDRTPL
jgi:hypothetical protein